MVRNVLFLNNWFGSKHQQYQLYAHIPLIKPESLNPASPSPNTINLAGSLLRSYSYLFKNQNLRSRNLPRAARCQRKKLTTISKRPGHTKLIHHFLCAPLCFGGPRFGVQGEAYRVFARWGLVQRGFCLFLGFWRILASSLDISVASGGSRCWTQAPALNLRP